MEKNRKKILIINGSVRGAAGNSGALAQYAAKCLQATPGNEVITLTLTDPQPSIRTIYDMLCDVDAFLVLTGTYWNSWGSPLQRFIEVATAFELSPAFFGKPVACAVSMDSAGGMDVAGRIHAVFSGLGCWSPPCASIVLSRVGQEAIAASEGTGNDANEDVWRMDDLQVLLQNLVAAMAIEKSAWVSWPHNTLEIADGPWPAQGPLDMNSPKFL